MPLELPIERDLRIMINVRSRVMSKKKAKYWENQQLYMEIFATGSTKARQQCMMMGLDPDGYETIRSTAQIPIDIGTPLII
jgi:hypothetical protein